MEVNWDTVGIVPKLPKKGPQPQQEPNRIAQQEESLQEQNVRPNRNQGQEHTGVRTRSHGLRDQTIDTQGVKREECKS